MANVLEIFIDVKGAEDGAAKLAKIEAAVSGLGGGAAKSAAGVALIGTASQKAAGQAKQLVDQFGKPIRLKGAQAVPDLGAKVKKLESQVALLNEKLKKTGAASDKAGQGLKGFIEKLKSLPGLKQLTALTVGMVAFNLVLGQLKRAATSAFQPITALEDSVTRFNVAMSSVGQFSASATKDALAFGAAMQKVTAFSDDAVLGVQALIGQIGQVGGPLLERATQAALDLSVGIGTDLRTAAVGMGKAFQGNTDVLSEYGILIDQNLAKSDRFAAALEKIEQTFGGAAQGQVQTLTGRITQLGNEWDKLKKALTAPFIPLLTTWVQGLSAAIDKLRLTVNGTADFGLADAVSADIDVLRKEADRLPKFNVNIGGTGFEGQKQFDDLVRKLEDKSVELKIKSSVHSGSLKTANDEVAAIVETARLANGALDGAFDRLADFARSELAIRMKVEVEQTESFTRIEDLIQRPPNIVLGLTLRDNDTIDTALEKFDQLRTHPLDPGRLFPEEDRPLTAAEQEVVVKFKADIQGLGLEDLQAQQVKIENNFKAMVDQYEDLVRAGDPMAPQLALILELWRAIRPEIGQALIDQANLGNILDQLEPPENFASKAAAPKSPASDVAVNFDETIAVAGEKWQALADQTEEGLANIPIDALGQTVSGAFMSMIDGTKDFAQTMVGMIKGMVASLLAQLAKLLVFKALFGLFSGGTGTIFTGLFGTVFDKATLGGFDAPNPPATQKGGSEPLSPPPAVLDFTRQTGAGEIGPGQPIRGALQLDELPRNKLGQEQRREVTINVKTFDSQDLTRSLRTGELGRAIANLSRAGR